MFLNNQDSELSYSLRFRVVLKYVGQLTLAVGALTIVPAVVSLVCGDFDGSVRFVAIAVGLGIGGYLASRIRATAELQANEALVIAAVAFLVAAISMTYPFMATGLSVSDALFEAVSGVTTTGLSTVADIEQKSASFLFARAWLQWYGGLGIVVLWAALALGKGGVSKALQGIPQEEELVGGTIARSRLLLAIYCLVTGMAFTALVVTGIPAFTALLHSLAAVSTGGFSPFNQSLAGLRSSSAVAVVIIACVVGAIPTMSYYHAWRRGLAGLIEDRQLWCLFGLGVIVAVALFPWMPSDETVSLLGRVGHALATAFSAQTTAGFATVEIGGLDPTAKIWLIFSMAIGGGAGSTAGGLKLLRLLILIRFVQAVIVDSSLPRHAVAPPRLAGRRLNSKELQEACVYLTMGMVVVGGSWLAFVAMNYDPLDSLFEVVSAMGTVGLSSGLTGPQLPPLLKGVLCVDMLMGRLEIVAIVVLFYPRTWLGNRRSAS